VQVSPLFFSARALPGPAVAIDAAGGSDQKLPANHPASASLIAVVTDQYGNEIPGQMVTWTVESGPVAFLTMGGATDSAGRSSSVVTPTGATGPAVVRGALPGVGASTDFALTILSPTFEVVLFTHGAFAFVSSQNGSRSPAVDTIPAGQTMRWTLQFDYDVHGVAPVGMPTFTGGDFPYATPSTVSVTFATPGTYHYTDPYNPAVTGIVVVQ
jgi:plastocyanin